jgi:hypothetical protein
MPPIRGLGAVKPHVKAAAEEIAARFQIYNIGGFATSGHATNSDHYTGHAIDVMTVSKGTMVAEWALANAARLSVKYIIWNRRINTLDGRGWRPYNGPSPHTDHVHISFRPGTGDGSVPVDAANTGATSEAEQLKGCIGKLLGL